ncbi:class I SAM-dependent methyltransferase [Alphaproteobacteria bacterium]|nr:class I SAM-dependent methyltransferase [Alphaproteobacteria bacterium]
MSFAIKMKIDHKESHQDFGAQFTKFQSEIDAFGAQIELLKSEVHPFELNKIKNKSVMEIGSGNGRVLLGLLKFSPRIVYAIEPSSAINILKSNVISKKVRFIHQKGEQINYLEKFDYIFSMGVIHHIPEHSVVIKNAYHALKPDGELIFWVYGREGNEVYLLVFNNLRRVTRLLPDKVLLSLSKFLACTTYVYGSLCRLIKMPLKQYFIEKFNTYPFGYRAKIIFDQLNPSYSKYFHKSELATLLEEAGFREIIYKHKQSSSWTVIAKK